MPAEPATTTLADIRRQPEIWRIAVERANAAYEAVMDRVDAAEELIFMGAGCSHAVAMFAQAAFQQHLGRPCRAASPMDFFQFPKWVAAVPARSLFVVFPRSGETTETLEAQRYARKLGAKILCVSAVEDSPCVNEAHERLLLPEALEDALLPTVSTTAMMVAMLQLAVRRSEEEVKLLLLQRLHGLAAGRIDEQIERGREAVVNDAIRHAAFLGSGPMLPAAEVGALLWQMSTGQTASFSTLFEFRHGPMQICGPETLVAVQISNAGRREDAVLSREVRMRRSPLLASMTDPIQALEEAEYSDIVGELVTDYSRAPLVLPLYQSMAVHRAIALGRDPDELIGQSPIVTTHLKGY